MKPISQFLQRCRLLVFQLALGLLFSAPILAQTAQSYRQRAIELSRNKSWDQAIASYRKALDLEPNDADTHYNLALALKYRGDAKQAVKEPQPPLRLKPQRAHPHHRMRATRYELND